VMHRQTTEQDRRDRKAAPRPIPPVSGTATIEVNGVREQRCVRMYEKLPGWWARGTVDQRETWLREFFGRQIAFPKETLDPGVVLVGVICEVPR
jgi:hypothetical protein